METPPLRIEFLCEFLSGHSHEVTFEGLFRSLDLLRYEASVIYAAKSTTTSACEALDFFCTHFTQPLADPIESFQVFHSLDLDVFYFRNIEISFYQLTLPFITAPPIQIKEWELPQISDIREISFFMSPAELELTGPEVNYTEALVRLPGGLPCYFSVKELGFTSPASQRFSASDRGQPGRPPPKPAQDLSRL